MKLDAQQDNPKLSFFSFFKAHRYTRLLAPILAILGITDITRLVRGETQNPIVLGMVLTTAAIAIFLAYRKLKKTTLKTASQALHFYPFLKGVDPTDRDKFILPRSQQLTALKQFVSTLDRSFGVVTGGSGVGKSTLIRDL